MKSCLIIGKVSHRRTTPVPHSFSYPVYMYAFDLDELERLDSKLSLFGYNRFRAVAIHDSDYLSGKAESIRTKLDGFLKGSGCHQKIERVVLVTSARFFGYVFNPVSFYYCYLANGHIGYVVAEVNNTFGERHLYVLSREGREGRGFAKRYTVPKDFHVSPFYDMEGFYDFHFSELGSSIDIRINILREGKVDFTAKLAGETTPLSASNLRKTLITRPLMAWRSMPRILWQAAKLRYLRRLPVYRKPVPQSRMTIKPAPPRIRDKFGMRLAFKSMREFSGGQLKVHLPNGSELYFGDLASKRKYTLVIKDYRFFWSITKNGAVGFGESFMDGEWSSPDVPGLIGFLAHNLDVVDRNSVYLSFLKRVSNSLLHFTRRNTIKGSSGNIRAHYDLSNEFFKLFLDETMTYSSGMYTKWNDTSSPDSLRRAQYQKLDTIIEKARISKSDHVLEIGSGWGSFAIRAAQTTGCRVTTLTLSHEQHHLVEQRVKELALEDSISVELCDYRNVTGEFDKIVSIEMLEAVGHRFYSDYFRALERLLKPNGLVVLQVITMPDQRYKDYLSRCDWIQKYIFPGSNLPSLNVLTSVMTEYSALQVEGLENIGPDYAISLNQWRERFLSQIDEVREQGFDDRFIRMWNYYLAYCEAAFRTRTLNNLQLVLTRKQNQGLNREQDLSKSESSVVGVTKRASVGRPSE